MVLLLQSLYASYSKSDVKIIVLPGCKRWNQDTTFEACPSIGFRKGLYIFGLHWSVQWCSTAQGHYIISYVASFAYPYMYFWSICYIHVLPIQGPHIPSPKLPLLMKFASRFHKILCMIICSHSRRIYMLES